MKKMTKKDQKKTNGGCIYVGNGMYLNCGNSCFER